MYPHTSPTRPWKLEKLQRWRKIVQFFFHSRVNPTYMTAIFWVTKYRKRHNTVPDSTLTVDTTPVNTYNNKVCVSVNQWVGDLLNTLWDSKGDGVHLIVQLAQSDPAKPCGPNQKKKKNLFLNTCMTVTHENDSVFVKCCCNQSPYFHLWRNDTNVWTLYVTQGLYLFSAPHYEGVMAKFSSTPGIKLSK